MSKYNKHILLSILILFHLSAGKIISSPYDGKLNKRVNVEKIIGSNGEIGDVLIDGVTTIRFYAGSGNESPYNRALAAGVIISQSMNEGTIGAETIILDKFEKRICVKIKGVVIACADDDAKFLRKKPIKLADEWVCKLRSVIAE
ncbi:MAG: hypothetical protein ABH857_05405 [Elusimicrobiota bacterium]